MKKLALVLMVSSLLVGCGGGGGDDDNNTVLPPVEPEVPVLPEEPEEPEEPVLPEEETRPDFGIDRPFPGTGTERPFPGQGDRPHPQPDVDEDFGQGHNPDFGQGEPSDPEVDEDFGQGHNPDYGQGEPADPEVDGDFGVIPNVVTIDWLKQVNDVTVDEATGHVTATIVGKSALGKSSPAMIAYPMVNHTVLGMYDVEWEVEANSKHFMNIYLSCEGVKRNFVMYPAGNVQEHNGTAAYADYAEFKEVHNACVVVPTLPGDLLMQKSNFIWRSSDNASVVAGETFTVKNYTISYDKDGALPDFSVDEDFGVDHDVLPVIDVDMVKQANDITADGETGYVTAVVAGKSALGKTSPALVYATVAKGLTLSQYDFEWEIEADTNHYVNVYLQHEGTKYTYTITPDGVVTEASVGVENYASFAEFKAAKGDYEVVQTTPGDLILKKGNFIWRSSQNLEVVAGTAFTVKQFNVTYTE